MDGTGFRASCQRAASRERIGETAAGRGKSVKGVHVMPLRGDAREILRGGREAGEREAADAVRARALRRLRPPVPGGLGSSRQGRHRRRGARGRPLAETPPRP